jgi:hypothetical protein
MNTTFRLFSAFCYLFFMYSILYLSKDWSILSLIPGSHTAVIHSCHLQLSRTAVIPTVTCPRLNMYILNSQVSKFFTHIFKSTTGDRFLSLGIETLHVHVHCKFILPNPVQLQTGAGCGALGCYWMNRQQALLIG